MHFLYEQVYHKIKMYYMYFCHRVRTQTLWAQLSSIKAAVLGFAVKSSCELPWADRSNCSRAFRWHGRQGACMLTSELYHVAGLGFCDANLITFLQKPLEAAGWCQPLRAGSAAEKWLKLLVCKNRVELSFTSFFFIPLFFIFLFHCFQVLFHTCEINGSSAAAHAQAPGVDGEQFLNCPRTQLSPGSAACLPLFVLGLVQHCSKGDVVFCLYL